MLATLWQKCDVCMEAVWLKLDLFFSRWPEREMFYSFFRIRLPSRQRRSSFSSRLHMTRWRCVISYVHPSRSHALVCHEGRKTTVKSLSASWNVCVCVGQVSTLQEVAGSTLEEECLLSEAKKWATKAAKDYKMICNGQRVSLNSPMFTSQEGRSCDDPQWMNNPSEGSAIPIGSTRWMDGCMSAIDWKVNTLFKSLTQTKKNRNIQHMFFF